MGPVSATTITLSHVSGERVPPGRERALLAVNERLALSKLGIDGEGARLATAQIGRDDVDRPHLEDAISAVLAAVRDARAALGGASAAR